MKGREYKGHRGKQMSRSVDEEHVIKAQWRSVLRVVMIQFPDNSETENS